jgi:GAF domain-containing protein
MDGERVIDGRMELLRAAGEQALAAVTQGASLSESLTRLVLEVERQSDGMFGSILLLDDGHLKQAAAPSLPATYNSAIDGVEIGPAVGSCGTAAYYGEPVYVDDIKTDPLWADFADLALGHGLRACWSTPIKDRAGQVLGTFASYYREVRHPRPADYEAIDMVAGYVARAIGQARVLA